jgi:hypothetical protein
MGKRSDLELKARRRSYIDWLKKELREIKAKDGNLPPYDKLITFIMSNFDVARRTAKEYLDVALAELESEKAHE